MAALATKTQILERAGYKYNFDREVYFNREAKKVFSVNFIEDKNEEQLEECIVNNTGETDWQFFFNSEPSKAVKQELKAVLNNVRAHN